MRKTDILSPPYSKATDFVIPTTACLDAVYVLDPGPPTFP